MSEHSRYYPPSSAERWLHCTASIDLCAAIPRQPDTPYQAEGIAAHAELQRVLEGEKVKDLDPAVATAVEIINGLPGLRLVEQRVTVSDDLFGTADVVLLPEDDDVLRILDYKHGVGVRVFAENNPQLMLYALGVLTQFRPLLRDVQEVELHIVQPRLSHHDVHTVTVDTLATFQRWVDEAMAEHRDAPQFRPSDTTCQWCPVIGSCAARADEMLERLRDDFTDLPLEPEAVARILDRMSAFEHWAKEVRADALRRALAGETIPGYRLVESVKHRVWADPDRVSRALSQYGVVTDVYAPRSLVSPAQFEKLAPHYPRAWEAVEPMIVKPKGGPALAPMKDRRRDWDGGVTADDFEGPDPT